MNRAIPVRRVTTHAHLRASDGPRPSRFEGQGFENRAHDLTCHLTRLGAGLTLENLMTENRSEKADVRAYANRRNIKYTEALRAFSPAPAFHFPTAAEWENHFERVIVLSDGFPPMFLRTVSDGPIERVDFQLPLGLAVSSVALAINNLRVVSHCQHIVLLASDDPSHFTLEVAELPISMPAAELPPAQDLPSASAGPIPFGVALDNALVVLEEDSAPSLLIVGPSGVGKTMAVRGMIAGYRARGGIIRALASDPGMLSELGVFSDGESASSLEAAATMLSNLEEEVSTRANLLDRFKVETLSDLPSGLRVPQILVAVDGLLDRRLRSEDDEVGRQLSDIADQIEQIARWGGALGIRVVLTVQTAVMAGYHRRFAEYAARLVIGQTTEAELESALRAPWSAPTMPACTRGARYAIWEPVNGLPQLIGMFYIDRTPPSPTPPVSEKS
jgi:hypothetical protein